MNVRSWGLSHPPSEAIAVSRGRLNFGSGRATTFFGNGRSYGDSCLNKQDGVLVTRNMDRLIDFDSSNGVLTCEGGITLGAIQSLCVKRGWMLPVTPGTQMATLAGAIANDVHGKNHHFNGCLGNHVLRFKLLRSSGEEIECSSTVNPDMYAATIGGLGLTGLIKEASVSLRSVPGPWLFGQDMAFGSLREFFQLSEESKDWEYTVAWLDGSKPASRTRGIFSRANHSSNQSLPPSRLKLNFPIMLPTSAVRPITVYPFNELYFRWKKRITSPIEMHYQPFFYPLDSIQNWNRMYGKKGFFQYQFVVPTHQSFDAMSAIIDRIHDAKAGSFLSVLKIFGDLKSPGLMSFPMPGATLAMDFPNLGQATSALLDSLDEIVSSAGGRLYAAKDSRMSAEMFHAGYPNLPQFIKHRDPMITSDFAKRVGLVD